MAVFFLFCFFLLLEGGYVTLLVLLAVTWVKYLCYFEAFLKLASSELSFSKYRGIIQKLEI